MNGMADAATGTAFKTNETKNTERGYVGIHIHKKKEHEGGQPGQQFKMGYCLPPNAM